MTELHEPSKWLNTKDLWQARVWRGPRLFPDSGCAARDLWAQDYYKMFQGHQLLRGPEKDISTKLAALPILWDLDHCRDQPWKIRLVREHFLGCQTSLVHTCFFHLFFFISKLLFRLRDSRVLSLKDSKSDLPSFRGALTCTWCACAFQSILERAGGVVGAPAFQSFRGVADPTWDGRHGATGESLWPALSSAAPQVDSFWVSGSKFQLAHGWSNKQIPGGRGNTRHWLMPVY